MSTKYSHPARILEEEKHSFLSEVLDPVVLNDIPPELIFNWDQTGFGSITFIDIIPRLHYT